MENLQPVRPHTKNGAARAHEAKAARNEDAKKESAKAKRSPRQSGDDLGDPALLLRLGFFFELFHFVWMPLEDAQQITHGVA